MVLLLRQVLLLLGVVRHLILQFTLHFYLLFQQSNLLFHFGLLPHIVRHYLPYLVLFLDDLAVCRFLFLEQLIVLGLQLLRILIHTHFHFVNHLVLVE